MKIIILAITMFFSGTCLFSQKTATKKTLPAGTVNINVPDFANPAIKRFYEAETLYLKKAVLAVRNKDEAACRKLYKEPKELDELREQTYKLKPSPDDV